MSRFIVDLSEPQSPTQEVRAKPIEDVPAKRPGRWKKVLGISAIVLLALMIVTGIVGYFYWQHLKTTPQYSLALLVDAARHDDQNTIDQVVNTDAVVDDFLPQITGKAVEIYGRGLPPQTIAKVSQIAAPILPAVKARARDELPGVIREKTEKFESIPFWAIAVGAERYLEIRIEGDIAFVKSKIPERPLEVKMRRNGDRWQVIGVKDDALAAKIAQKIGQNIIAIAQKGVTPSGERSLGIRNLQELLEQAQEILP
jgi:hypothetical protein